MKKIINLILVISIIYMLFKMFFILNVNEDRLKYNYNEIKLLINKPDVNVAHKTFSQFDEYFTDVYIDSTEIYQLQNSLKLYPEKILDFHLNFASCNDLKCLLELFENNNNDSFIHTEYEKEIFENIMITILEYLLEENPISDIGYNLLSSFNNIKSKKYNDYVELNLVLKPVVKSNEKKIYNEIFGMINDVNDKMLNILEINVQTKNAFGILTDYVKNNSSTINIKLNEYYYGFSNSLDDLRESENILNNNNLNEEPGIFIESILDYLSDDNSLSGNRFKKIKRYSRKKENEQIKSTISNKEMIDLLNSYKYYINQTDTNYKEDYIFKKNILKLIDQTTLELAKKDNIVKIAYMQDQFYKTKKNFSRYFYSLEPITLEYINSSVKKEFVYNDYFISKIFIKNSSYKYFNFVNSAFKGKTTIKFTNQVFLISFVLLLLLLLLNNFKLVFSIIKK